MNFDYLLEKLLLLSDDWRINFAMRKSYESIEQYVDSLFPGWAALANKYECIRLSVLSKNEAGTVLMKKLKYGVGHHPCHFTAQEGSDMIMQHCAHSLLHLIDLPTYYIASGVDNAKDSSTTIDFLLVLENESFYASAYLYSDV